MTQHVKAQQHLIDYMKQNGMLEHVPQPIQDELNSVAELAKMMQTQNDKKPEFGKQKEGEQEREKNNRKPKLTGRKCRLTEAIKPQIVFEC